MGGKKTIFIVWRFPWSSLVLGYSPNIACLRCLACLASLPLSVSLSFFLSFLLSFFIFLWCIFFETESHYVDQTGLKQCSYLNLLSSWDCRCEPLCPAFPSLKPLLIYRFSPLSFLPLPFNLIVEKVICPIKFPTVYKVLMTVCPW